MYDCVIIINGILLAISTHHEMTISSLDWSGLDRQHYIARFKPVLPDMNGVQSFPEIVSVIISVTD